MQEFEVVVIGAGHAGSEAALATARKGHKTLCVSVSLDNIGYLACNPSIGGTAKGQLASEIDALGGEMGVNADKTLLQLRILNSSKGPAVWSLRAQVDKNAYHTQLKKTMETTPNLKLKMGEVTEILTNSNKISGVKLKTGEEIKCKAVIVCTGVYLQSQIIMGEYVENIGPSGFKSATLLTQSLENLGIKTYRFKTGTPARIDSNTIDYTKLDVQKGETNIPMFSFLNANKKPKNKKNCYLVYTNENTHQIIRDNLDKAPMYSGLIKGVGPRYCPSIESKIVRFADKDRHQLFLEPEALETNEMYLQGFSTSMPVDIQEQMVHSLVGFENAFLMRNAYAIEYDAISSLELYPTLAHKNYDGLYFAGQVNGTSGYEEAGAQGIIAGINAALWLENKKPLVLKRSDAYIGVLIDDLTTKGTNEPYRMMTSRAEYRLHLRQDNADLRLTEIGRKVGLVNDERWAVYQAKLEEIEKAKAVFEKTIKLKDLNEFLSKKKKPEEKQGIKLKDLAKREFVCAKDFAKMKEFENISFDAVNEVYIQCKYEGYLKRAQTDIKAFEKSEKMILGADFDYSQIKGLKQEAKDKLMEIKPLTLGQASRISGVSPADIAVLSIYIKMQKK